MAINMALVPAPRAPEFDAAAPAPKKAGYGQVPEYLEQRKAQWQVEGEARRKAAEIKAACPPGHRMLPEEERVETLALVSSSLEAAKKEVRERVEPHAPPKRRP